MRHKGGSGEFVSIGRAMADSWVTVGQRGTVYRRSAAACDVRPLIGMIGAQITWQPPRVTAIRSII